jgi:hypothetical protein
MSRARREQSGKGGRGESMTAAKIGRNGAVLAALIGAVGAVVAVVVAAVLVKDGQSPNVSGDGGGVPASVERAPTVGGVWVHPHGQHATIGPEGLLVLEVDAYGGGGGVGVSRVQFTTDWDGWHVLCTDPPSSGGNNRYSCTWDMKQLGVPIGQEIAVSFDVYGSDGSKNLAPNGLHYVRWGVSCVTGPGGSCGGY